MKTKPEFHVIDIQNSSRKAVFEANTLALRFVDTQSKAESLIKQLEAFEVQKPQRRLPPAGRVQKICFESTNACNMACTYCFQEADPDYRKNKSRMEIQIAIDCLQRYAPASRIPKIKIGFMGGEPLLNMDLIARLIDYTRSKYEQVGFSFTTNGLLLAKPLADHISFKPSPEQAGLSIAEFLSRHNIGITLSLDGPEEVQDEFRVLRGGTGSYATLLDALESTRANVPQFAKRIAFRATFNPNIIDSPHKLVDRLRFFNELIADGYGGSIHIEPVALPGGTPVGALEKIEQQYIDATEWFIDQVKAGLSPSWNDVVKRVLARLYRRQVATTSCGAGQGYLTCGVDGTMYACHRTAGADVGSIKEGIDTDRMSQWEDNRIYHQIGCGTCSVRHLCGGTCRASNLMQCGTTRQPAEFDCFIRKTRVACAMQMMESLTNDEIERILPKQRESRTYVASAGYLKSQI